MLYILEVSVEKELDKNVQIAILLNILNSVAEIKAGGSKMEKQKKVATVRKTIRLAKGVIKCQPAKSVKLILA